MKQEHAELLVRGLLQVVNTNEGSRHCDGHLEVFTKSKESLTHMLCLYVPDQKPVLPPDMSAATINQGQWYFINQIQPRHGHIIVCRDLDGIIVDHVFIVDGEGRLWEYNDKPKPIAQNKNGIYSGTSFSMLGMCSWMLIGLIEQQGTKPT